MEKKIRVQFVLIESIGKFANAASNSICSIDLQSDRHIIDGKSLLGIYSLNLSNPVTVVISAPEDTEKYVESANKFINEIKDIIIDD